MPHASPAEHTMNDSDILASPLPVGLVLHARTQIISPTGSTPPAVAPLRTGDEHAISFAGPYPDSKHDPTSQQCIDGTSSPVKPQGGMRAVEGGVLKSPEHSSGESGGGASAFKTTGSRLRTSYAPQEAAVGTSDGLIKTGFGPTVLLPPRLLVSRSKGFDARSKVPAACR